MNSFSNNLFTGKQYTSVCQAYRNSDERRDIVLEKLEDVEFVDPTNRMFKFNVSKREPDIGYRYNALVPGRLGGVLYNQVSIIKYLMLVP